MKNSLRVQKRLSDILSCSQSNKMADYFCFCLRHKEHVFVHRVVSIWVCGETDVNQTLCDSSGRGKVGNEMEDVIKGGKKEGLSKSI